MEGYGINVYRNGETRRYRTGSTSELAERWNLPEAAEIAIALQNGRSGATSWVTIGDGGSHEFRLFAEDVSGGRWADWYVDVEMAGRRWRYRPMADLDNMAEADETAAEVEELDEITKIWVGASDGSEEYEKEKQG